MAEEKQSLDDNCTWKIVNNPEHRKVLGGKWVFKHKRAVNGEIIRYKARWVVRGFEQKEGIDYNETFASVVKPMSYKAIFAVAAALGLYVEQMDVKTAFLYGDINEEIYVEQPNGLDQIPGKVCLLKKALYGLKQSPHIWYNTLAEFLKGLGFHQLSSDLGVFTWENYYMAIYVDDLLLVGPKKPEIEKVKQSLNKRFKMTDLGPCSYYLGMSVRRDLVNWALFLGQRAYLDKVIRDFGMAECKPVSLPMDPNIKLQAMPADYEPPPADLHWYASCIGSLMYAMLGTRPDIAFAVSTLSRYMAKPGPEHITAAKQVLRYLKGSINLELTFRGDLRSLIGYTDADWAGDIDTRRSTSGYLFNIGSGSISWSSKRQPTVSLSSCEAEYQGQTQATKEAMWLRRLLNELVDQGEPNVTIIYGDNQGALALAKNPTQHGRTKHIDIQHHFVREKQAAGEVDLRYVPTAEQLADGLTKALPGEAFRRFRIGLGLEER